MHTSRFAFQLAALFRGKRLVLGLLLVALIAAPLHWAVAAPAAPKYGNSLDLIPADAAFYSASLRLKEQIDIVANSKAWAKLTHLPAVQMAWQFALLSMHQQGGPMEQWRQFAADPDNQQLLSVLSDAVSTEIFVYGDQHAADFLDIALRTYNSLRYGSMIAGIQQRQDDSDTALRILLNSLDAEKARLNSPGIVLGFKLTSKDAAQNQLKRLEALAKPQLDAEPMFQGRLKHATVGGVDFLTLELDGSMVPWHEVPWERLGQRPGQYNELRAKLLKMTVTISLGVRGDYLMLAIGPSTEPLAALGTGKMLTELPELKPLEKFADRKLVDIAYTSKAMLSVVSSSKSVMDQWVGMAQQLLPSAGLPNEINQRIIADIGELANDIKGAIPLVGAQLGFSFLTASGTEGYHYDWSENLYLDATKPLEILDHAGGNPLLVAAGRSKYSPNQYEMLRKWMRKGFAYFEDFAAPQFTGEQQVQYAKIKQAALPLIERLDRVTAEKLIPALADGQTALVLDAKIKSTQWFQGMPQSDQALPMLEPGLVVGVSDAKLLKEAFTEYAEIANAAMDKILEFEPNAFGGAKPPKLALNEQTKVEGGTLYWNKLPAEWGIDPQLTPNVGVGEHYAVAGLTPKQSEKLLTETPLKTAPGGPLANRKQPLAGASYFNFAGTIDAATPWIDFGIRQFAPRAVEAAGAGFFMPAPAVQTKLAAADDPTTQMILQQVHSVLEVLKCFQASESATYSEDSAMVTHTLSVFHDAE